MVIGETPFGEAPTHQIILKGDRAGNPHQGAARSSSSWEVIGRQEAGVKLLPKRKDAVTIVSFPSTSPNRDVQKLVARVAPSIIGQL